MTNTQPFEDAYKEAKAALAAIEPEYLALLDTMKSLEKLLNVTSNVKNNDDISDIEIPKGTFDGLTMKDTALICIFMANRDLTTRQITDLVEGTGYQHSSSNFWNTMNTTLARLLEGEKVEKVDSKWKLTDAGRMHVEHLRNSTLFSQPSTI